MGRISDEDIQRVRDATDLVSLISERVVLKKKGRLFWGLCPFHGEKTPSFKVDPGTQLWHCFGCSEGGDAFGFIMRTENLEFPDAVRRLAERAHIEIVEEGGGLPTGRKERLIAACAAAAAFYHEQLTTSRTPGAVAARDYLKERGFGIDVAKRFNLGYAPHGRDNLTRALMRDGFTREELVEANLAMADGASLKDRFYNRIMFPIADLSGRVIAFGGRVVGTGEPKYLNTAETPIFSKSANLYAIDRARNEIVSSGAGIVVEGYTDVIALHEAGIAHAVATLGTALTERHVRLLGRFASRVVYLFDGDAAGIRAADRAAEFIDWHATPEAGSAKTDLLVAIIPEGADPADYVAANGAEGMRALIEGAQPLLRFVIDQRLAAHDLGTPEGRARALEAAAVVLTRVRGSILEQDYTNYLADRLLTDFATVRRAVVSAKPELRRGEPATFGRTTEGDSGTQSSAQPLRPLVEGPQEKAERELLRLAVISPAARAQARELIAEGVVSGEDICRVLSLVAETGDAQKRELYDALARNDRAAAEMVSPWLVDAPEVEEVEYATREIVGRLKDFDLGRQILAMKAQLRGLDAEKDRVAFDGLFREIAELQRLQESIRRGLRDRERSGGGDTE
ncbi:MAG: DNA primase [Coriobacteriia bacterium]|nr:DNA primase [Coriobacteriia bacterium]